MQMFEEKSDNSACPTPSCIVHTAGQMDEKKNYITLFHCLKKDNWTFF